MGALMEVPLKSGDVVLVEVDPKDVASDLKMAAPKAGEVLARAKRTLEDALDDVRPAVEAVAAWTKSLGPDEYAVEFGIKVGGQTSAIVASGTAEVNFVVKLNWSKLER